MGFKTWLMVALGACVYTFACGGVESDAAASADPTCASARCLLVSVETFEPLPAQPIEFGCSVVPARCRSSYDTLCSPMPFATLCAIGSTQATATSR